MFYVDGEDIIYEVIPLKKGKKVKIYISKKNEKYAQSCKCFGTHYLEQTFDEECNLIREVIKNNPDFVKCNLPDNKFERNVFYRNIQN